MDICPKNGYLPLLVIISFVIIGCDLQRQTLSSYTRTKVDTTIYIPQRIIKDSIRIRDIVYCDTLTNQPIIKNNYYYDRKGMVVRGNGEYLALQATFDSLRQRIRIDKEQSVKQVNTDRQFVGTKFIYGIIILFILTFLILGIVVYFLYKIKNKVI